MYSFEGGKDVSSLGEEAVDDEGEIDNWERRIDKSSGTIVVCFG